MKLALVTDVILITWCDMYVEFVTVSVESSLIPKFPLSVVDVLPILTWTEVIVPFVVI